MSLARRRSPTRARIREQTAQLRRSEGDLRFAQWIRKVGLCSAPADARTILEDPIAETLGPDIVRLRNWRAKHHPVAPTTFADDMAARVEATVRSLWSRELYGPAVSVLYILVGPIDSAARVIHDSVSGFSARLHVSLAWLARVFRQGLARFGDRLVLDAEPAPHAHVPDVFETRRISYVERVGKRLEMRQEIVYRHPTTLEWHRVTSAGGPLRLLREARALGLVRARIDTEDPRALARTPELDHWVAVRVCIPAETYALVRMAAAEQAGILPSVGEHIARAITDQYGPVKWDTLMRALALQDPSRRPPPAAAKPAHPRDEWTPPTGPLPDDDR